MFIIDTNILMRDYKNLELLESDVVIPITVIRELDNHKNDSGGNGYNARRSLRIINDAYDNYGILPNGFKMIVDSDDQPISIKNDDLIIDAVSRHEDATLVTGDLGMKICATDRGISVRRFADDDDILNPGKVEELTIDYELLMDLFKNGQIPENEIDHSGNMPNACYMVRDENRTGSALIRRINNKFIKLSQPKNVFGKITGKNIGQRFYLDMLLDPRIKIILVNGVAGSGKTLLALAAACQLREGGKFNDIICAKSVEEVGARIGFRPGEEESKIAPYYAAFGDNLSYLAQADIKNGRCDKLIPEVTFEHVGYMRGRTFRNAFMIIDECQNFTPNEMKTIISRAGEGSKIVCCGDLHQIDNNQSAYTNGLFYAQRKLIGQELVGVISLPKSERSDIAKLAALL